uniref:DNA-directed RNA polymerase subunit beta'' n=1 Tax=Gonium pectorale TaxID=33097 RepID=M1VQH5_GONPE|nr:RNA polymerase beta' subunit [Gonium pectorale]BAM85943.1 RNA polymerase beta' subunit [Gonium pectorale]
MNILFEKKNFKYVLLKKHETNWRKNILKKNACIDKNKPNFIFYSVLKFQGRAKRVNSIRLNTTKKIKTFSLSTKKNNASPFFNMTFDKGRLKNLVSWTLENYGQYKTVELLEQLKKTGFEYATKAGISLGIDDLKIPPKKNTLLLEAEKLTKLTVHQYQRADITAVERFQRLIDTWHRTSEQLKQEVISHFEETDILNPVYMMAFSGARGNISQVRQLVGMRGLMSDPQGQIIDFPIQSNFREGLTLTEYIISSYGARKGIVDTALRTANAGYLTRRLVDVAQHVIISHYDCGTQKGIFLTDMKEGNKTIVSAQTRIVGRVLARDIYKPDTTIKIASRNQEISTDLAFEITKITNKIFVRSSLTCNTNKLLCQLCYGWSLAQGNIVSVGEAVGVIAAQSIGEPGTQLTMRTFHTGGVFSGDVSDEIRAPYNGYVYYRNTIPGILIRALDGKILFLTKADGTLIFSTNSIFDRANIQTNKNKKRNYSPSAFKTSSEEYLKLEETIGPEKKIYKIPAYTVLFVRNGESVFQKQVVAQITNNNLKPNLRDTAELIIKSELEGLFYAKTLQIKKKIIGPKPKFVGESKQNLLLDAKAMEIVVKARGWNFAWVLSGKRYEMPLLQKTFAMIGDYITPKTVIARHNLKIPSYYSLKQEFVTKKMNFSGVSLTNNSKYLSEAVNLTSLRISLSSIKNLNSLKKINNNFIINNKIPLLNYGPKGLYQQEVNSPFFVSNSIQSFLPLPRIKKILLFKLFKKNKKLHQSLKNKQNFMTSLPVFKDRVSQNYNQIKKAQTKQNKNLGSKGDLYWAKKYSYSLQPLVKLFQMPDNVILNGNTLKGEKNLFAFGLVQKKFIEDKISFSFINNRKKRVQSTLLNINSHYKNFICEHKPKNVIKPTLSSTPAQQQLTYICNKNFVPKIKMLSSKGATSKVGLINKMKQDLLFLNLKKIKYHKIGYFHFFNSHSLNLTQLQSSNEYPFLPQAGINHPANGESMHLLFLEYVPYCISKEMQYRAIPIQTFNKMKFNYNLIYNDVILSPTSLKSESTLKTSIALKRYKSNNSLVEWFSSNDNVGTKVFSSFDILPFRQAMKIKKNRKYKSNIQTSNENSNEYFRSENKSSFYFQQEPKLPSSSGVLPLKVSQNYKLLIAQKILKIYKKLYKNYKLYKTKTAQFDTIRYLVGSKPLLTRIGFGQIKQKINYKSTWTNPHYNLISSGDCTLTRNKMKIKSRALSFVKITKNKYKQRQLYYKQEITLQRLVFNMWFKNKNNNVKIAHLFSKNKKILKKLNTKIDVYIKNLTQNITCFTGTYGVTSNACKASCEDIVKNKGRFLDIILQHYCFITRFPRSFNKNQKNKNSFEMRLKKKKASTLKLNFNVLSAYLVEDKSFITVNKEELTKINKKVASKIYFLNNSTKSHFFNTSKYVPFQKMENFIFTTKYEKNSNTLINKHNYLQKNNDKIKRASKFCQKQKLALLEYSKLSSLTAKPLKRSNSLTYISSQKGNIKPILKHFKRTSQINKLLADANIKLPYGHRSCISMEMQNGTNNKNKQLNIGSCNARIFNQPYNVHKKFNITEQKLIKQTVTDKYYINIHKNKILLLNNLLHRIKTSKKIKKLSIFKKKMQLTNHNISYIYNYYFLKNLINNNAQFGINMKQQQTNNITLFAQTNLQKSNVSTCKIGIITGHKIKLSFFSKIWHLASLDRASAISPKGMLKIEDRAIARLSISHEMLDHFLCFLKFTKILYFSYNYISLDIEVKQRQVNKTLTSKYVSFNKNSPTKNNSLKQLQVYILNKFNKQYTKESQNQNDLKGCFDRTSQINKLLTKLPKGIDQRKASSSGMSHYPSLEDSSIYLKGSVSLSAKTPNIASFTKYLFTKNNSLKKFSTIWVYKQTVEKLTKQSNRFFNPISLINFLSPGPFIIDKILFDKTNINLSFNNIDLINKINPQGLVKFFVLSKRMRQIHLKHPLALSANEYRWHNISKPYNSHKLPIVCSAQINKIDRILKTEIFKKDLIWIKNKKPRFLPKQLEINFAEDKQNKTSEDGAKQDANFNLEPQKGSNPIKGQLQQNSPTFYLIQNQRLQKKKKIIFSFLIAEINKTNLPLNKNNRLTLNSLKKIKKLYKQLKQTKHFLSSKRSAQYFCFTQIYEHNRQKNESLSLKTQKRVLKNSTIEPKINVKSSVLKNTNNLVNQNAFVNIGEALFHYKFLKLVKNTKQMQHPLQMTQESLKPTTKLVKDLNNNIKCDKNLVISLNNLVSKVFAKEKMFNFANRLVFITKNAQKNTIKNELKTKLSAFLLSKQKKDLSLLQKNSNFALIINNYNKKTLKTIKQQSIMLQVTNKTKTAETVNNVSGWPTNIEVVPQGQLLSSSGVPTLKFVISPLEKTLSYFVLPLKKNWRFIKFKNTIKNKSILENKKIINYINTKFQSKKIISYTKPPLFDLYFKNPSYSFTSTVKMQMSYFITKNSSYFFNERERVACSSNGAAENIKNKIIAKKGLDYVKTKNKTKMLSFDNSIHKKILIIPKQPCLNICLFSNYSVDLNQDILSPPFKPTNCIKKGTLQKRVLIGQNPITLKKLKNNTNFSQQFHWDCNSKIKNFMRLSKFQFLNLTKNKKQFLQDPIDRAIARLIEQSEIDRASKIKMDTPKNKLSLVQNHLANLVTQTNFFSVFEGELLYTNLYKNHLELNPYQNLKTGLMNERERVGASRMSYLINYKTKEDKMRMAMFKYYLKTINKEVNKNINHFQSSLNKNKSQEKKVKTKNWSRFNLILTKKDFITLKYSQNTEKYISVFAEIQNFDTLQYKSNMESNPRKGFNKNKINYSQACLNILFQSHIKNKIKTQTIAQLNKENHFNKAYNFNLKNKWLQQNLSLGNSSFTYFNNCKIVEKLYKIKIWLPNNATIKNNQTGERARASWSFSQEMQISNFYSGIDPASSWRCRMEHKKAKPFLFIPKDSNNNIKWKKIKLKKLFTKNKIGFFFLKGNTFFNTSTKLITNKNFLNTKMYNLECIFGHFLQDTRYLDVNICLELQKIHLNKNFLNLKPLFDKYNVEQAKLLVKGASELLNKKNLVKLITKFTVFNYKKQNYSTQYISKHQSFVNIFDRASATSPKETLDRASLRDTPSEDHIKTNIEEILSQLFYFLKPINTSRIFYIYQEIFVCNNKIKTKKSSLKEQLAVSLKDLSLFFINVISPCSINKTRFFTISSLFSKNIGLNNKNFPFITTNLNSISYQASLANSIQVIKKSGQLIHMNKQKITLRLGQPLVISPRSIIHASHGDFIRYKTAVITLTYQQLKTGDIVQGIPKIEQLFEARTTKRGRLFRDNITNLLTGLFLKYFVKSTYLLRKNMLLDGIKGDIGQKKEKNFNDNLQTSQKKQTLDEQFYKQSKQNSNQFVNNKQNQTIILALALQWSVKQSFYKIQQIIVDGILRVYRSQGVSIADKHVEIIVKQMTSKVRIINSNASKLTDYSFSLQNITRDLQTEVIKTNPLSENYSSKDSSKIKLKSANTNYISTTKHRKATKTFENKLLEKLLSNNLDGPTGLFPGEIIDIDFVENINLYLLKTSNLESFNTYNQTSFAIEPIKYEPIVLGITRASLEVESFLSAASFQQTTRVLSQAALYKKKDFLKGLKENIIIGNLIPAGTGYLTSLNL